MGSVRMAAGKRLMCTSPCPSMELSATSWGHLEQIPKEELSCYQSLILEVRSPENVCVSAYFLETLRLSTEGRI